MFLKFKEGPHKSVLDLAVQYCRTGHRYLLAEHGGTRVGTLIVATIKFPTDTK